MIDVIADGKSIRQLLAGTPSISDQVDAVCRTMDLTPQNVNGLDGYMGQTIELWFNNVRWFKGVLLKRTRGADGSASYSVYDPLYYWKRYPDDWYFKNVTATQALTTIAETVGTKIYNIENTGAVLPTLYYQAAEADKVGIDLLANTYKLNGRRFWYRYNPGMSNEGLHVFERKVSAKIWAFQVGINLVSAEIEESIEETATVIKLVNRDTGTVVTKVDTIAQNKYGTLVHFEEVDKDKAANMDGMAQDLLSQLSKVNVGMKAEGINPGGVMQQFYSGDAVYVEESNTGIIGGYYIRNVTQTFEADDVVRLSFDIVKAPDLPTVQYEDTQQKAYEKDNPTTQDNGAYNSEYTDDTSYMDDGATYADDSGNYSEDGSYSEDTSYTDESSEDDNYTDDGNDIDAESFEF